jgi:hypothetical protein
VQGAIRFAAPLKQLSFVGYSERSSAVRSSGDFVSSERPTVTTMNVASDAIQIHFICTNVSHERCDCGGAR